MIAQELEVSLHMAFMEARQKHAQTDIEQGIAWRHYVLAWVAKSVISRKVPGDFVECACYKGTSARIICDYVDFSNSGKYYYLYDLFEHDDAMPHHSMAAHSATLYDEVRARFPEPNVIITKGRVPDSLSEAAPERIAFMHLDLNNAKAEIGALEVLWDRILPGGVLVLDDFGWAPYIAQHALETEWFAKRGHAILEMPTGQGLVIKHA